MVAARRFLASFSSLLVLASCSGEEPKPTQEEPSPSQMPALPIAEPTLDRRGLLLAVADVASLDAAGRDDAELQRKLERRSFAIRLRFGCRGGAADGGGWTFDERERVLRIHATPEISAEDPIVEGLLGAVPESVEGFWIRRPWLLDVACPTAPNRPGGDAPAPSAAPMAESSPDAREPPAPRIGIAQIYTEQDSRAHRRNDRPLSATVRLENDERPSTNGYDLVLSGRLTSLPGGRVIACRGDGQTRPPTCIVSAEFDRISLATPEGETIAEWSAG